MYKFSYIILLSIFYLNLSFFLNKYNFGKKLNTFKLHQYKYENEYYEFYNKFKQPLLASTEGVITNNFIERNKESYLIFERNYDYIKMTNTILKEKNESLTLDINQFADSVDFNQDINNDLMKYSINKDTIINKYTETYLKPFKKPIQYMNNIIQHKSEHNWNNTDYLSPVKNQEKCGSCWAFSTTSAIETFMRINNFTVDRLSEQEFDGADLSIHHIKANPEG